MQSINSQFMQIKFILQFDDAIGFTSDMKNFGFLDTNELINKGEKLCSDLEKMK
jgi:hypothetical protein